MDTSAKANLTRKVHEALRHEGFELFGVADARAYPEEAEHISEWIAAGHNGSMTFMERNGDKRGDITALVTGARSVIEAALSYYSNETYAGEENYFVARYARVRDYHLVMKDKLRRVNKIIEKEMPGVTGRVFCDSAPVTEKTWAVRAGLGWRGRHSIIINKDIGSFMFLGEIVTTAELVYNMPYAADHCRECRKCIDACPTGAICDNRTIDARRCIAYLTIEHEGQWPSELAGRTENIIFGCDRCQEVCPWNKKSTHFSDKELIPDYSVTDLTKKDWQSMTPETFRKVFRSSPVIRTGFENIRRNIEYATFASSEKR